jgi:Flp pilus assembly protein TadG
MTPRNTFSRPTDAAARRSVSFLKRRLPQDDELLVRNHRKRSFTQSENGGTLVEFALGLPVMFALMFGLIEVCLALYSHEYISELAREGARYAMVHGSTCVASGGSSCTATAAQVQAYVSSIQLPNFGGGTVTPVVTYPAGNETPGSSVKVKVTYAFPYRIPFVPSSTLTMSSTSVMDILQ